MDNMYKVLLVLISIVLTCVFILTAVHKENEQLEIKGCPCGDIYSSEEDRREE